MKYLMTFSYNGTKYDGYQIQNNGNTIQQVIQENLSKINSNKIVHISSSGRTDKGVHALNQKAHFILDKNIDNNKLKNSLNKLLPDDIYVKDIIKVDENFHARFNVIKKEYIYKINLGEYNPIEKDYIYQYNKNLNIDKIKKATKYLIGTHNFKCFTKVDEEKETYVRTIYDIELNIEKNVLTLKFIGNGFLRYMIRNIVGTLINIGENKFNPEYIKEIIESKDRKKAGMKAPACGLYLSNVYYK